MLSINQPNFILQFVVHIITSNKYSLIDPILRRKRYAVQMMQLKCITIIKGYKELFKIFSS